MNFRKFAIPFLAVAAAVAAFSSCKKNTDTTYEYLDGDLKIVVEKTLVSPGEKVTFTVTGLKNLEDKEVGYKWSVSDVDVVDTVWTADGKWSYTFPEDLKSTTITCGSYCPGYYSSTSTVTITTVKAGADGSIPEIYETKSTKYVTDSDGYKYLYTTIGGTDWMTRNLGTSTHGIPYRGESIMDNIVGRFYSYNDAVAACAELPGGNWKLPTDADWMAAAQTATGNTYETHKSWAGASGSFMTYATLNGTTLWEFWPAVKVTNATGLMAISVGRADMIEKSFDGLRDQAVFWTADECEGDSSKAYVRYIVVDQPDMHIMAAHKDAFGATVRCIRKK